ncbi:MAG: phytoene desaturase family protein [Alphaproteobacteria bacterium]
MTSTNGAIVVGGSVGGLVAAAYLARGGMRVTLLEARNVLGGEAENAPLADGFVAPLVAHTLYALDPVVVRDLQLHRQGLAFVERDMPLVALRPGGRHIVIPRDAHAARSAIAAHAAADADGYVRFRREAMAIARRLRPLWTGALADGEASAHAAAAALKLSAAKAAALESLSRMSAAAYLDRWLESDALKAALGFEVSADGFSPLEAGSALALIWRYAQESCGLQAAVSQPKGGPGALVQALTRAAEAAGAELRTGTAVRNILAENGAVRGVLLESKEVVEGATVLSCLPQLRTFELVPPAALGLGETAPVPAAAAGTAKMLLALNGLPPFVGLGRDALRGRLIIAERPESAAEAKGAALAGRLPAELVMEAAVPSVADPSMSPQGQHVLSARVPYLPLLSQATWNARREVLAERVLATLESYAPGLRERIVKQELLTPSDIAARYGTQTAEAGGVQRLLTPCVARARTPLPGVYLCGASAEAVSAVSGCAGRVAARLVLEERAGQ